VLEKAVSLLRYINSEIFDPKRMDCDDDIFFSTASLGLFQSWLCAQSQRCAFELFLAYPKPKHFVLAKLSIATLPFLQEADDASKKIWQWVDDNDANARKFWSHWADTVRAWQMYFTALTEYHQAKSHAEKSEMAQEAARLVAGIRFATLCRKHLDAQPADDGQSGSAGELQGKVIAILDEMTERLKQIQREHDGLNVPEYKTLTQIRPQCMVKAGSNTAINPATLTELLSPFPTALFENVRIIPATTAKTMAAPELATSPTETASLLTATFSPSSEKIHEKAPSEPEKYVASPTAVAAASPSADLYRRHSLTAKGRQYIEAFQRRMELAWMNTSQTASESTERARRTLSQVSLPHALTQYQQEVASGSASGATINANDSNGGGGAGGLPQALWERVKEIQKEGKLVELKKKSWELRDLAETAHMIYHQILEKLKEDEEMDAQFRELHEDFEGHVVQQVQSQFRHALQNYDRLLSAAQESDELLLQRCQGLDTDPKFKLLKFQKSQFDHFLPGNRNITAAGAESNSINSATASVPIDVSALSGYLVELSALLEEREKALQMLKEKVLTYDLAGDFTTLMKEVGDNYSKEDDVYRQAVARAEKKMACLFEKFNNNLERQGELLLAILKENEVFLQAREANRSRNSSAVGVARASDATSIIDKLEDALDEIDQFSDHLKDGRDFYDAMIPKLDKLKLQVGDVSARLTVERCEYEDKAQRSRQELEDARMAATLAAVGGGDDGGAGQGAGGGGENRPQTMPGVDHVDHSQPSVRIDDEKVAYLVAMEFDPEKVVDALRRHDNNVEVALNDLLSE